MRTHSLLKMLKKWYVVFCLFAACIMHHFIGAHTQTPTNGGEICRLCKKPTKFVEINRNLGREHQLLFRKPADMVNEFVTQIKKVMEFQTYHRQRLQKHREDQVSFLFRNFS